MTSKAVVFAYHDIGCTGIEALLNAGYEIAAVFTHADDPRENTFYASVARLCAERGIPLHAPEDVNHPLWLERIRQLRPDFLFSFYYRRLLGAELNSPAPHAAPTACTVRCCRATADAPRRTGCWSTAKRRPG